VANDPLIVHPDVRAVLTTPVAGNYHPLTIWSLALNYRLSGLNPVSYHWLNLLLHLANTLLVFVFIRKLARGRTWTPIVTALFFGIHPMHVESVAWIAERKDVLYAFFYLLSLIAYLRYLDGRRLAWLGAALAGFVLSAASKPAAVVLPVTLIAIDYFRRRRFDLRLAVEKVPFFAVSLLSGLASLHAQKATGALADVRPWSLFQKVLVACYGTFQYFVKLIVPTHLSAIYPHPNVAGESMGAEYYLGLAFVVLVLPALVYLLRRSRAVLFGLAFFFINIVLVIQFFRVGGALMADRYTYVPYIGLFFALAWWLDERGGAGAAVSRAKPVLAGALMLLVPFSAIGTWTRCQVWKNGGTLWDDTIRKYPHQIYDAYLNRGWYNHRVVGNLDAARADFDQAIALNPGAFNAWLDKGALLVDENQLDSAYVCFDRTIQLNPAITDAWNARGVIKLRRGDPTGAIADFSKAIDLNPAYRSAYANRADAYSLLKDYGKAFEDYRHAATMDPANPESHFQVGVVLHDLRRYQEAIAEYDAALRLAPVGDPRSGRYHLYRSYAWSALGERKNALSDALEAQREGQAVDPSYLRGL
jgi:tetratricopeptide (TPR) repeat protein